MTKIVVDTNILFSVLLNVDSRIGQILINGNEFYTFYSPEYIHDEIFAHKSKIKSLAGLSENEFILLYDTVIRNLYILNHAVIPVENYKNALKLCKEIDVDDAIFVAVSLFVDGFLWTGDKKLLNGLIKQEFENIITTKELHQDFLSRQKIKS
mgnify:CR=1 FL=1